MKSKNNNISAVLIVCIVIKLFKIKLTIKIYIDLAKPKSGGPG